MKKTDLAKSDAKKLMGQTASRPGKAVEAATVGRREQRELERAQGLVPFAVKLNNDLVQRLHAQAKQRAVDMNQLVADVLEKGLAG